MVGSLFGWKSFWQNRSTTDDLPTADSPAYPSSRQEGRWNESKGRGFVMVRSRSAAGGTEDQWSVPDHRSWLSTELAFCPPAWTAAERGQPHDDDADEKGGARSRCSLPPALSRTERVRLDVPRRTSLTWTGRVGGCSGALILMCRVVAVKPSGSEATVEPDFIVRSRASS